MVTSNLEKSDQLARWHIGKETFSRLDGSTFDQWYIYNTEVGNFFGGFESEKEAITFLLTKLSASSV